MKIWIICTGEPVPFLPDEVGDRFLRAGKLAQHLAAQGHDVTWWTARFDHYGKRQRDVPANTPIRPAPDGPEMIFLDSIGYQNHMGPRRFFDHWQIGRAFRRLAPTLDEPDVILAAFPLVETCANIVAYGRARGVPTILDVRDLWPDVLYERLAARIGFSTKGMFVPYEVQCAHAFRGADRVVGITNGMQNWCYDRFGRDERMREVDAVFRQFKQKPGAVELADPAHFQFWSDKGVDLNDGRTRLVWSGSIIRDSDGPTLVKALDLLPAGIEERLQVVVCGTGSLLPDLQALADRRPFLKCVGWVPNAEVNTLLERSHVGLLCYLDRFDFQMATPNKVIDYCAAGMRILTNLSGELQTLAPGSDLIINYPTGGARALADIIATIADQPDVYRVKYERARRVFAEEFDAAQVMPAFERYLVATAETHR